MFHSYLTNNQPSPASPSRMQSWRRKMQPAGSGTIPDLPTVLAMAMSSNCLILLGKWDYTFYKWSFLSTYNW